MLKAAQIATTEPGPDAQKRIHQRHFVQGMEEVITAESVMSQSLFESAAAAAGPADDVLEQMAEGQERLRAELGLVAERLDAMDRSRATAVTESERRQAELLALVKARAPRGPWIAAVAALVLAAVALVAALVR